MPHNMIYKPVYVVYLELSFDRSYSELKLKIGHFWSRNSLDVILLYIVDLPILWSIYSESFIVLAYLCQKLEKWGVAVALSFDPLNDTEQKLFLKRR